MFCLSPGFSTRIGGKWSYSRPSVSSWGLCQPLPFWWFSALPQQCPPVRARVGIRGPAPGRPPADLACAALLRRTPKPCLPRCLDQAFPDSQPSPRLHETPRSVRVPHCCALGAAGSKQSGLTSLVSLPPRIAVLPCLGSNVTTGFIGLVQCFLVQWLEAEVFLG